MLPTPIDTSSCPAFLTTAQSKGEPPTTNNGANLSENTILVEKHILIAMETRILYRGVGREGIGSPQKFESLNNYNRVYNTTIWYTTQQYGIQDNNMVYNTTIWYTTQHSTA